MLQRHLTSQVQVPKKDSRLKLNLNCDSGLLFLAGVCDTVCDTT